MIDKRKPAGILNRCIINTVNAPIKIKILKKIGVAE